MKILILVLLTIILLLSKTTFSQTTDDDFHVSSEKKVSQLPKGGLKENDIVIKNWNPPSSLSSYVGKGTDFHTNPYFYFNLNLGYLRIFTKAKFSTDDTFVVNKGFPFIVEFKPFDFAAFLSSGSNYALFVDRNEWLRNLTFILSNYTFASSQYINSFMLWYGDFLVNAVMGQKDKGIAAFMFSKASPDPKPGQSGLLEFLFPPTRNIGIGLSDRIHIYQSPVIAVGLMMYFEFTIPPSDNTVMKNIDILQTKLGTTYPYFKSKSINSDLTYSVLGGVFFRFKKGNFELNSETAFERKDGNFDGWMTQFLQQTLSQKIEIAFSEQYFIKVQYYLLYWANGIINDDFYFHHIDIGGEIRGFGKHFNWIGVGFDLMIDLWRQEATPPFGGSYYAENDIIALVPSIQWYPLGFHGKNHKLRISLLYGFFKMRTKENRDTVITGTSYIDNGFSEWRHSVMLKVDYSF
ncbi:MAG: hypothetical protein OEV44_12835 [Spirochaetota bacterium]|nr:hypothetical protein [Spirochaetota bacterium]